MHLLEQDQEVSAGGRDVSIYTGRSLYTDKWRRRRSLEATCKDVVVAWIQQQAGLTVKVRRTTWNERYNKNVTVE